MEVTCDRCGAEYEFEETLISLAGTTVKCTACGHLFKVHRDDDASEAPPTIKEPAAGRTGWTVRTGGRTEELDSLADLTRGIEEGRFDARMEISRGGRAWRRLGDIAELQSFFPAGSQRPPVLGIQSSALPKGVGSAPPPPNQPSNQPTESGRPAPMGDAVRPGPSVGPSGRPGPVSAPPPPVRVRSDPPPPIPQAANRAPTSDPPGPMPSTPDQASEIAPSTPPQAAAEPASGQAQPEPAERPPATRGRPLPVVVLLSLALAAGLVWALSQDGSDQDSAPDAATVFVVRADAALAAHRPRRFEEALTEYTKALAFHEVDANILSAISRVHAVWSQYLQFEHQALLRVVPHDEMQLASLLEQQRQHADAAKRYAQTAARKNPGSAVAEVALADALRLTGNLVGARNELDRARANDAAPDAETLRVGALLRIAEHHQDLTAGRELARQATTEAPTMLRARALLCRILANMGDLDGARRELETIRSAAPAHPLLEQLAAALTPPSADSRPDAGATDPRESKPKKPPVRASGGDVLGLIKRAERLLEDGKVFGAKALFERAIQLKPNSARAQTGMGYVSLELGRARAAARYFRPAAGRGSGEALIGLGEAYRKLGRMKDALVAYQRYTRRHPLGKRLTIAKRQIEIITDQLED